MPPQRKLVPYDYLKYYRIIKHFTCIKYKISPHDLDLLLFLYSERYFTRANFEEYDNLLSWDKYRFSRLLNTGWIDTFRIAKKGERYLYEVSYHGRNVIKALYNKLSGDEIPMSQSSNPMFAKNVRYKDKVYRIMIKEMNKEIRASKLKIRI